MAETLRSSGFLIVTLYDEYGDDESKIADSVMIQDCGLKGRVLLTADLDLGDSSGRNRGICDD